MKDDIKIEKIVEKEEEIEKEIPKEENKKEISKYKTIGVSLIITSTLLLLAVISLALIILVPSVRNYIFSTDESSDKNVNTTVSVTDDEQNIINVVKNSQNSVVSIAVTQVSLSQDKGVVDSSSNVGSGFIVDPNGIIVTNQHVVSDTSSTYKVITSDGTDYAVQEILRDDSNDIAVLKIDATNLDAIDLGDSDALLVGQTVIAIGTPLGEYAGSVTTGIISGLNRSVTASSSWFGSTTKSYDDVIQTDAAVNPGNSGGPLINSEGKVVGVNFATTSSADNISFALPINKIKSRLEEYRTYGKFIIPYIGVSYQMISSQEALFYNNVVAGALILSVAKDSPASDAGIKRGDIVTKINDTAVENSLSSVIQSHKVGDKLTLEVWNNSKTRTVEVTLEESN